MPSDVRRRGPLATIATWLLLAVVVAARPAAAQIGSDRYAAFVIDAGSGNVLVAANPDEPRYPASLTKMMTLYLLFESLRDHRLALTDNVPVSPAAAAMPPTKLGLVPGMSVTVEQAIFGLVTKSANDAAAALGELMGGTEEQFAQMMTLRAHALGMPHTQFRNASGLPDWDQVTTARDLAVLARHLIQDFPEYYHYFSTTYFLFHGRTVLGHQHMLQTYPGADGLKTGFIEASGYNMVTSAVHGDVRLIGVVMGAANGWERDQHMASLLDQGFTRMGVPVEMARREPPPGRSLLFGAAQAAPLPPRYAQSRYASRRDAPRRDLRYAPPVQVDEMRVPRGRPVPAYRVPVVHYPSQPRYPTPPRPVASRRQPAAEPYEEYVPRQTRAAAHTAHTPSYWYRGPG